MLQNVFEWKPFGSKNKNLTYALIYALYFCAIAGCPTKSVNPRGVHTVPGMPPSSKLLLLAAVALAGCLRYARKPPTVSLTASPVTTYIQPVLQVLGNTARRGIPINTQIPVKNPESRKESRAMVNYYYLQYLRPESKRTVLGMAGGGVWWLWRQTVRGMVCAFSCPP